MNMLRGQLRRDEAGSAVLQLDEGAEVALGAVLLGAEWFGKPLVVGVRPEHLQPGSGAAAFNARIEGLEPVGNEIFVNLRYGEQALIMRVPPQQLPQVGQEIAVEVSASKLHFFEAASGSRIEAGA